jgi:hypothetical protein
VDGDPVVRPERLHLEAERVAQAGAERQRPRCMHTRAERGEDADAPVADLVAEALDDDGPVRGHGPGRRELVVEECEQVLRCLLVQEVPLREPRHRLLLRQRDELAGSLADLLAELVRAARPLALPEGDHAGHPGRR